MNSDGIYYAKQLLTQFCGCIRPFSKLRKLANWQFADCNRHINCDRQDQKPEFLTGV